MIDVSVWCLSPTDPACLQLCKGSTAKECCSWAGLVGPIHGEKDLVLWRFVLACVSGGMLQECGVLHFLLSGPLRTEKGFGFLV